MGLIVPGWEANPSRWSWAAGRWTFGGYSTTSSLPAPWQGCVEPTFRYWYRQMDIQLDSILSTTVSDLEIQKGLVLRGPLVPLGSAGSSKYPDHPQSSPASVQARVSVRLYVYSLQ